MTVQTRQAIHHSPVGLLGVGHHANRLHPKFRQHFRQRRDRNSLGPGQAPHVDRDGVSSEELRGGFETLRQFGAQRIQLRRLDNEMQGIHGTAA